MSFTRAVLVALIVATIGGASCTSPTDRGDAPKATRTNFVVVATYPSPNLTVYVNGQNAGAVTQMWTGGISCGSMLAAGNGLAVSISAFVGQTYSIRAIAPNGRYVYWDPITVDQARVDSAACWALTIRDAP